MLKPVIREIAIFSVCFLIFPGAVLLLYLRGEIGQAQLMALARELVSADTAGPWPVVYLLARMLIPYLFVQAIRAHRWAKQNVTGLRYANLYYSIMLLVTALWFWGHSWDLFYFMYAMDDLPGEIPQFIELEALNLLVGFLGLYLSYRCFRVYLFALDHTSIQNPNRR